MRLSKLKKGVIYGGLLAFLLFLLLHSGSSIEAVQGALQLCTKTVIPSLFPFFVLTGLMTGSGLTHSVSQIISPVTKRIFRIEGAESFPFVMGILCGYPTGAKCLMSLYEKN